jgi:hypothetical protein
MVEPRYTVKALDQSTWAAFAALVERNNGIFGGCWCMGFHPKESWTDVAQKRAAKEQRVREGKAHAALVFDGEDCVGWCQFGAPDEVPRIKSRAAYEKGRTTSPDWRIACCYVGKRRNGVRRGRGCRPSTSWFARAARGHHTYQRLPETTETHVVWLITQRSEVQILPPLPRPGGRFRTRDRPSVCRLRIC